MLNAYVEPIITAVICFPILAFLMTLPYLIYEYRKYGAILLLRTVIVYSFVLYLLVSYFLVILPLPPRSLVAHYTSPTMQLHLGQFLNDIIASSRIVWNNPSTYLSFLKSPTVYTVLFNLFLTMPFGIYLRYYYRRNVRQVIVYSFLLSLFFELTQLSGLYGIYPRSYRLFDVDDLFINTFGGLLGYFVAPLFMKILPSRASLDEKALQKGKQVTLFRRGIALLIDFFFLSMEIGILSTLFPKISSSFIYYVLGVMIYFLFLFILLEGRTIGKCIVRLKCVNESGTSALWYQLLLRNILLYLVILPTPYYLHLLASEMDSRILSRMLRMILVINYLFFLCQIFTVWLGKRQLFGYERISRTKNVSMIVEEKSEILEE